MGCGPSKGTSADKYVQKESKLKKSSKLLIAYSRRDEVVVEVDNGGSDATTRLISEGDEENAVAAGHTLWDGGEKNNEASEKPAVQLAQRPQKLDIGDGNGGMHQPRMSRLFSIKNGVDGVQAAAGWPSWLTAVAGEAIKGWLPRRADSFEKMDKIGEGTYSNVYRARDLETGKIVALKKVRFVSMDPESVRFMAREIIVLRRLDHPNVIKLEGLVTSRVSSNLYLVFEYMEHDLAGLAASPTIKFTEPQIKCYMQQLLRGLEHCHNHGILHRDIKSSNLLIDNNGNLKIGDFGLAATFHHEQKQPLTSRVVTLWYRPPELLLGATDYGVAVDLWSAGCVLAELFAGKPIMRGRTEVEQLHKIFKLCGSPSEEYWRKSKLSHATSFKPQNPYKRCVAETFKDFPPSALALLDSLLAVEPDSRGSTSSALMSEFFTTKPLPCNPSSLPTYPPSKEYDAKMWDDEKRRNHAGAGNARGFEYFSKGTRESRALPEPDANAELQASIQKRREQQNPKSISEKYNLEEYGDPGFGFEPSSGSLQNGPDNSQLMQHGVPMNVDASQLDSSRLSMFSNSVADRSSSQFDLSQGTGALPHWPEGCPNGKYHHINDAESSHNMLDRSNFSFKKHGHGSSKGYPSQKNQIHYSGPLLPGGNMEDLLKEHEKQIQHAIRKALIDKNKNKNKNKNKKGYGENGHMESLLK